MNYQQKKNVKLNKLLINSQLKIHFKLIIKIIIRISLPISCYKAKFQKLFSLNQIYSLLQLKQMMSHNLINYLLKLKKIYCLKIFRTSSQPQIYENPKHEYLIKFKNRRICVEKYIRDINLVKRYIKQDHFRIK